MRTNLILYSLYFLALALAAAMNSFASYQPTNDTLSSEDVPPVRNVSLMPLGSSCTGTILSVTEAGEVFATNGNSGIVTCSKSGQKLAEFKGMGFVAMTASGNAVVKNNNGDVREVSAIGETIWQTQIPAPATEGAISTDGYLYMISGGSVYAISSVHQILWHWDSSTTYYTGMELRNMVLGSDGAVYVVSPAADVVALDREGKRTWQMHPGSLLVSRPAAAAAGRVYISDTNNLVAIGPDGSILWRYRFPVNPLFLAGGAPTPVVAIDGDVYIARRSFFCIRPDGKERWRFHPDTADEYFIASPTLGSDGTIYLLSAATERGRIYALSPDGAKKWSYVLAHNGYMDPPMRFGSDGSLLKAEGNGFLAFSVAKSKTGMATQ
jgi:hypothetical protein